MRSALGASCHLGVTSPTAPTFLEDLTGGCRRLQVQQQVVEASFCFIICVGAELRRQAKAFKKQKHGGRPDALLRLQIECQWGCEWQVS